MVIKRTDRLNSLLKEVLSDVIRREVKNPHVAEFMTITQVQISKDLRHAKVFVSIMGTEQEKKASLQALNSAAGFIAIQASQQVVMRYFPELIFKLDDSLEQHLRIEQMLHHIHEEQRSRTPHEETSDAEGKGEE